MDVKTCSACGVQGPSSTFVRHRNTCKACRKVQQKAYRASRPNYCIVWNMKTRYGLSPDDYQSILANQNFSCAICEVEISAAVEYKAGRLVAIDHNHETGEVRGILCAKCNLVLGHARESTDILYRAIVYLSERGAYTPKGK